jgi:DNA-binding cell septation regulator SpoVG
MQIRIEWFKGNHPSFNVHVSSKDGAEPFIVVKGARIVNGSKGEFVSWPATKNETTGKYWSHVYGSEKFNEAVLKAAKETLPLQAPKPVVRDDLLYGDSDTPF